MQNFKGISGNYPNYEIKKMRKYDLSKNSVRTKLGFRRRARRKRWINYLISINRKSLQFRNHLIYKYSNNNNNLI